MYLVVLEGALRFPLPHQARNAWGDGSFRVYCGMHAAAEPLMHLERLRACCELLYAAAFFVSCK